MLTADEIRELLRLEAHPIEGGFFAETWRAKENVAVGRRDEGGADRVTRSAGTAIYYLLTPSTFSAMHRLPFDEVFHFYLGDPVEMLLLEPGGSGRLVTLGTDLASGMRPQNVVPAGTWQGSRLASGGSVALLGTTMAPGFDAADYEAGVGSELAAAWPEFREEIAARIRVR